MRRVSARTPSNRWVGETRREWEKRGATAVKTRRVLLLLQVFEAAFIPSPAMAFAHSKLSSGDVSLGMVVVDANHSSWAAAALRAPLHRLLHVLELPPTVGPPQSCGCHRGGSPLLGMRAPAWGYRGTNDKGAAVATTDSVTVGFTLAAMICGEISFRCVKLWPLILDRMAECIG